MSSLRPDSWRFRSSTAGSRICRRAKGEQAARQIGAAHGRAHRGMDFARQRRRFGDAALEQLQVADHDAEQIVEVVRDAAGELADRFHLLRLQQPRFEALLLGEIVDDREETDAPRRSASICGTK